MVSGRPAVFFVEVRDPAQVVAETPTSHVKQEKWWVHSFCTAVKSGGAVLL